MAPANNRFFNSDVMVGLVSLCVGGVVWYSVTRPQGAFSPHVPGAPPGAEATPPLGEPDSVTHIDDPGLPANVNQAIRLSEKGHAREQAGDRNGAIELYKQAAKLDPVRKFYWSDQASVYLLQNNFEGAYKAFLQAYQRDSFEVFILNGLGYASQSSRKDAEARRFYLMGLTLKPESNDLWSEMYNLSHTSDWQQFSSELHDASVLPAKIENNNLLYRLNQFALDQNPDDYYLIVNRALLNLHLMHLDRVESDIDKALKINPRGGAALVARAQYLSLMGEQEKAAQAYRDCLKISPQPLAYAELGAIEMQQGKLDQAAEDYSTATQLGTDKPSWVNTLGKLRQAIIKRDEEAKEKTEKNAARNTVQNAAPTAAKDAAKNTAQAAAKNAAQAAAKNATRDAERKAAQNAAKNGPKSGY